MSMIKESLCHPDTKVSLEENKKQAGKYYDNYSHNAPGEAVPNKK